MPRAREGRIYLSPPNVTEAEVNAVTEALRSGWIAPLGPEVNAFEAEAAAFCGTAHAVALSSGTAALHLGLLALGVASGDEVVVPTMTFGATAFAVKYVGAEPVFLDSESESWNLDPDILTAFLAARSACGQLPAAIITVDVFGRPCNYPVIASIAERYGVPLLADAAESLGATAGTRWAGSYGEAAVFSFNGNKIMTTSGGGMLVTDNASLAEKVRFWASQSREPFPWYQHEEIGYNYRMSNLLAALGRVQLARLPEMITRRRSIRDEYAAWFSDEPGVEVSGDPRWGRSNGWLTTILLDTYQHPAAPVRVREALEREDIECRPIWKPMHQQPVFAGSEVHLSGVADRLFSDGLCLPSGSEMTSKEVGRVAQLIKRELAP
jgi:dTDP-4-amino-4,6-dideoxygalactose transaminase